MNLNDANAIKALLIDYLLNLYDKEILFGSELIFGKKKRSLDLVLVDDFLSGFEIKASNDDFRRVRGQLNDYKKIFDFQYLVVTENHLDKARKVIYGNEGIIVVQNDLRLFLYKKPNLILKHSKQDILETIPGSFLASYFGVNKYKNVVELRTILSRKKLGDLKIALFDYLNFQLLPRNELFFFERGSCTHPEDIRLLSSSSISVL
ncbi:sce7726 family protein [uncultured Draconibacterium sp.]|uniref:sce7726 family protein n=1 Tax=uncultured Draconibacterium sp. TaxID=1573823 RepID=UPI00321768E6